MVGFFKKKKKTKNNCEKMRFHKEQTVSVHSSRYILHFICGFRQRCCFFYKYNGSAASAFKKAGDKWNNIPTELVFVDQISN